MRRGDAADCRAVGQRLLALGRQQDAALFVGQSKVNATLAREAARLLRELSVASQSAVSEIAQPKSARPKKRGATAKRGVAKKGALGAAREFRAPAVSKLPGIGKVAERALAAKGIYDVLDLLLFLPRRYDDERRASPISLLESGKRALCIGRVSAVRTIGAGRRRRVEVSLEPLPDEPPGRRALLRLVWFRTHWVAAKLRVGQRVMVSGAVEEYRGVASMAHPDLTELESDAVTGRGIIPIYPAVSGLPASRLKKAIGAALDEYLPRWPEALPESISANRGTVKNALEQLHRPCESLGDEDLERLNSGRSEAHMRLAFEEFFILALSLEARRAESARSAAEALEPMGEAWRSDAERALGFSLTSAQRRCLDEVVDDLRKDQPMRRLLQGDVGAGKTAVAFVSAAHAVSAGAQVALLAPTEVLAEQHMRSLAPLAQALGLRIGLLVGGARAAHRRKILGSLADGTLDVIVGTHAILSDRVQFRRLGLAIVDEQHRFGVSQRLRLASKGELDPHLLVMTATPIPRSLALALYGDLRVSVLDEKPPGRQVPVTRAYLQAERAQAYKQVLRAIKHGGQVFVVCPAIEMSEAHELRAATDVHAELRDRFPDLRVVLMHGQQSFDERQAAMEAFAKGDAEILVSTTVIEVGVDVPRANAMLIENAERFGLAQLHQLRGRVGRGGQKSACLLVHDARTDEGRSRIEVLCTTDDGFAIAEEDLRLRGPGEVFGHQQAGLSGFRFADLRRDLPLLAEARATASDLLAANSGLEGDGLDGARRALERAARTIVLEEAG